MPSSSFRHDVAPRRSPSIIAWMIISQGLFILSLYPWYFWLVFTTVIFGSVSLSGLVLGYLWYPVLSLVAIIVGWVRFAQHRDSAAMYWTSLPLMLAFPQLCIVLMSLN